MIFLLKSIRLNIANVKAAVLPVPDCDCPIMFFGLYIAVLSIEDTREAISLTGSGEAAAGRAPGS